MKEITIEENGEYEYLFEKEENVDLKIIVKENVSCNIFEFTNNNYEKRITLNIEKGARVKHYSIVINTKECSNLVKQANGSSYNLKALNYARSSSYYTNNHVELDENESYCSMKIVNIASKSKISSKGLIRIDEKSFDSEGHQKFEGIILDEESSIDAKPDLEVFNDNVICSHGASITQIDDDKLFYLSSKGFNKKESLNLIVNGYFDAILSNLPKDVENKIRDKLKEKDII